MKRKRCYFHRKKNCHECPQRHRPKIKKTKTQVIYKFPTGAVIPKGAIYLSTIKNGKMPMMSPSQYSDGKEYVWHYFLVEKV